MSYMILFGGRTHSQAPVSMGKVLTVTYDYEE